MKQIRELYKEFLNCSRISIDSRGNNDNTIFFALKGDNFDGNSFAKKALKNGARLAIIDDKKFYIDERTVLVKNSLKTLQDLASYHRKQLKIPVIAITGTNGKTTTKELISIVLSNKYKTISTEGNLNNHIGVPLTVLRLGKDTEIAVVEMGANHKGEINDLCEIAQPTHGIITNIGKAHLEGFGNYDGVVATKKELYDYIGRSNGEVFLNSDNQLLRSICVVTSINYGRSLGSFVVGEITDNDPYVELKWKGENDDCYSRLKSRMIGAYNFENILCAVCVGAYFGVENAIIGKSIEEYKPTNNRSQIIKRKTNTIILDAYNANPTSMYEALKSFHEIETAKEKLVILGDMLELGNQTEHEHKGILKLIDSYGLSGFVIGRFFNAYAKSRDVVAFDNTDEFIEYLKNNEITNRYILVKGSRGNRLETIVDYIH